MRPMEVLAAITTEPKGHEGGDFCYGMLVEWSSRHRHRADTHMIDYEGNRVSKTAFEKKKSDFNKFAGPVEGRS